MQFILVLFLFICWLIYNYVTRPKVDYAAKLEEANRFIGTLEKYNEDLRIENANFNNELVYLKEAFKDLQHKKISGDVKLGQKYENILPFMAEFPYPDAEIRGLYNPLDLIVFTDSEVVFLEVKLVLLSFQKSSGKFATILRLAEFGLKC